MVHCGLIDWIAVALEVVATIRVREYAEPRLTEREGKRTAEGKKAPDAEHKRRKGTRELNEELSQYYRLENNQAVWGCPELLCKSKHGRDYSAS